MTETNYILSNTEVEHAPDRQEVRNFGPVECHYAVKCNSGEAHETQQDRASVSELPYVRAQEFRPLMQKIFDKMQATHDDRVDTIPNFSGDSCVTMTMFDPKSGMVAIGSKGDAATYLVMRNKNNPQDVIIKRISTHHQEFYDGNPAAKGKPRAIVTGSEMPVMWANSRSWRTKESTFMATDKERTQPADFELIDLQDVAKGMLHAREEDNQQVANKGLLSRVIKRVKPAPNLDNYALSLVMGSDGLTSRSLEVQPPPNEEDKLNKNVDRGLRQPRSERLKDIALSMTPPMVNHAEAILNCVSNSARHPQYLSHDNLSAIVLPDITFGKGHSIAACICDGNFAGKEHKEHGSIAAQSMIYEFETEMRRVREHEQHQAVIRKEHRNMVKQRQAAQVSAGAVR